MQLLIKTTLDSTSLILTFMEFPLQHIYGLLFFKNNLIIFLLWNSLVSSILHFILKVQSTIHVLQKSFCSIQTELYSKQSKIDLLFFFYLIGSLDQLQLNSGIQNTGQKSIQKQAHKYLGKKWNFKKLFLSYQQEKRTWFKTWICCARLMQKPWSDLKF